MTQGCEVCNESVHDYDCKEIKVLTMGIQMGKKGT